MIWVIMLLGAILVVLVLMLLELASIRLNIVGNFSVLFREMERQASSISDRQEAELSEIKIFLKDNFTSLRSSVSNYNEYPYELVKFLDAANEGRIPALRRDDFDAAAYDQRRQIYTDMMQDSGDERAQDFEDQIGEDGAD